MSERNAAAVRARIARRPWVDRHPEIYLEVDGWSDPRPLDMADAELAGVVLAARRRGWDVHVAGGGIEVRVIGSDGLLVASGWARRPAEAWGQAKAAARSAARAASRHEIPWWGE